jgi:hypothetical protein
VQVTRWRGRIENRAVWGETPPRLGQEGDLKLQKRPVIGEGKGESRGSDTETNRGGNERKAAEVYYGDGRVLENDERGQKAINRMRQAL